MAPAQAAGCPLLLLARFQSVRGTNTVQVGLLRRTTKTPVVYRGRGLFERQRAFKRFSCICGVMATGVFH